jgi:PAS domain S-box-containing protein
MAYGYAAGLTAITIVVWLALGRVTDAPLLTLFIVPIVISAWIGGLGPGLFAALASGLVVTIAASASFTTPRITATDERVAAAIFLAVALLTGTIGGRLQNLRHAAQRTLALSEQRAARAQALADSSQAFAEGGLDVDGVLNAVARLTGEVLGDLAVVRLLSDDQQRLLPGGVWHADPMALAAAQAALALEGESQALGMSRQVLESGRPLRLSEVTGGDRAATSSVHRDYLARYGLHSIVLTPLRARGRVIGILSVARESPGRPYTAEDQAFLEDLANRAAIAIDNARLYDALHHSEERYRSLAAATSSLVWTAAADGTFATHQPEWEAFTGQTRDEQAGWGWVEALHPDDRASKRADWERAHAERAVYTSEGRIWHAPSAEYHACVTRGVPLLHPDGTIREWVGTVTDVHEQAQVQQQLAASQERYRRIVELSNEGVWLIDAGACTTFANQRMAEMLGTTPEAMLGRAVPEYCFPDDVPLAHERIAQNIGGVAEQFDFRFRRADGAAVHVLGATSPVTDGTGAVVGALGMFVDMTARRQAELALQASEARYRTLVEAAPDFIFHLDTDGALSWSSPGFLTFTGRTEAELHDNRWQISGVIHPDDLPGVLPRWRESIARGDAFETEFRLRGADGSYRWHLCRLNPVRNARGEVTEWVGTTTDVDALKTAEAELARLVGSERRAAARGAFLVEAGAILAGDLDYETRLTAVAQLAVPVLADWCVVDVLGDDGQIHRLAAVHVDPEGQAAADELVRRFPSLPLDARHTITRVLETSEPWFDPVVDQQRFVAEARDADHLALLRKLGFASEIVAPLVARGRKLGTITLVFGPAGGRRHTLEDLTTARELAAQAALALDNARLFAEVQASEERLRLALQAGAMGTWDWDPASGRVVWSSEVEALYGLQPGSFDGTFERYLGLIHPEDRATVAAAVAAAAECGGDFAVEHRTNWPDGSVRWLAGRGRAYLSTGGELQRMAGTVMDITERKQVERLQREFLALVTHELKGPLTSLKGFAQLMRRRGVYDARGIEAIISQGNHLERLINDLLDAVRIEAGQLDLRPGTVDLGALVESSVEQLRATENTHTIQVTTPKESLRGTWDRDRLEQIVRNLLSNAIKYSPAGSDIGVTVGRCGDEACLTVADHGVGIAPSDLPRLFERFYRADDVRSYAQGLGLGLYITRSLVEAHGGRITVESMPDMGSSFTVWLPLDPAADTDAGSAHGEQAGERPTATSPPSPRSRPAGQGTRGA